MTREFHFFHFGELHSDNSINDKNNLFENYIPNCYEVKKNLISFNCFSEYIICLVEKNNIFLRFCLCIFESDTVNSDCPVQNFRKMMKYIKI